MSQRKEIDPWASFYLASESVRRKWRDRDSVEEEKARFRKEGSRKRHDFSADVVVVKQRKENPLIEEEGTEALLEALRRGIAKDIGWMGFGGGRQGESENRGGKRRKFPFYCY